MSARTFAVVIAVLAVIGLLGFGLLSESDRSLAAGDPAPGLGDDLDRLDGAGSASIEDYRGKWVLVNFWASWCRPCRDEAPELQTFHEANARRGFSVLGIDLDDNTDDAGAFVEEYGLTYPQLREADGRERRELWGMTGFPESFLVNPSGELALIRRGPVTADFLESEVLPLITGEGSSS
jgi:cytochrome c biogenesis protein CcmG, thiol:disulfide interchange protein DsbE